jgi:hypothetical protein
MSADDDGWWKTALQSPLGVTRGNDVLIVELEKKLDALDMEQKNTVAIELLGLLQLGAWPLEELRSFFGGKDGLSVEKLRAAKRAREKRIKSLPIWAFIAQPLRSGPNSSDDRIVSPACLWEGIRPVRVDHETKETDLIPKLHRAMDACDLFIANLTGHNANVYYEVGYLERAGKPGLFLTASRGEARFYLHSRDALFMPPGPEGVAFVRSKLRASLRKKREELKRTGRVRLTLRPAL